VYHDTHRQTATNGEGRWLLCDVPNDVPLKVSVSTDATRSPPVVLRVPPGWRIARFDLPETKAQRP
jgi:hypothetical protein